MGEESEGEEGGGRGGGERAEQASGEAGVRGTTVGGKRTTAQEAESADSEGERAVADRSPRQRRREIPDDGHEKGRDLRRRELTQRGCGAEAISATADEATRRKAKSGRTGQRWGVGRTTGRSDGDAAEPTCARTRQHPATWQPWEADSTPGRAEEGAATKNEQAGQAARRRDVEKRAEEIRDHCDGGRAWNTPSKPTASAGADYARRCGIQRRSGRTTAPPAANG